MDFIEFILDGLRVFRPKREAEDTRSHHSMEARKRRYPDTVNIDYGRFLGEFRGTPQERSMAAEASTWVMRCINYHVGEISKINWYIVDKDGNRQGDHPFHRMYEWALSEFQQDLFTRWITMRLVHGNVYFEKLYNKKREPGGLYVLNSQYIEPQYKDGQILEYTTIYSHTSPQTHVLKPQYVFYDKIDSLQSDIRGKSPMDRALTRVNIDLHNQQTIRSYMLNDNKPAAVLALRPGVEPYTDDEMDRILDRFYEAGKGPDGGYTTRILPGAFELQTFETQAPNLSLSEDARREICIEFGLDPAVLGATIANTPLDSGGVLLQKKAVALESTIIPEIVHIQKFINAVIMPWVDPDGEYKFVWDYNRIERLNDQNIEAKIQARLDVQSGLMTPNEYREFVGLPMLPNGDVLFIPKMYAYYNYDEFDKVVEESSMADAPSEVMPGNADGAPMESDFVQDGMQPEESIGNEDAQRGYKATLYLGKNVTITDEDVDDTIDEVEDDPILALLLEAEVENADELLTSPTETIERASVE